MNYTIIYKDYNESFKNLLEDKYLLIEDDRNTLLNTIKVFKKRNIEIVEVYRTNKNGINTNIKF